MIRKILIVLLVILIIIQFFRPAKNIAAGEQPYTIAKEFPTSLAMQTILKKACLDCHSNNTVYPWYDNIQPVAWWLSDHIKDGKNELNFDEFLNYAPRRQYHKMEEVIEQIKKGEMPLSSYTWIHKDAILSQPEKDSVMGWANSVLDQLKSRYPMDSLARPKK
jgi:Haem-binding domain